MTSPVVGGYRVAELVVADADGEPGNATTTAVLTVVSDAWPVTLTPGQTTSDIGEHWASTAFQWPAPGEWIERWTVTGKGAGVKENLVYVAPVATDVPSGLRVYATTGDYAKWLRAAPPTGSRRALAEASRAVDKLLFCAVYAVDDDGLPTDAEVAAAIRDATCAQAEWARATSDPNSVGAAAYHSVSIGGIAVTRGYNAAGSAAPGLYSGRAWHILADAGLTGHAPQEW